MRGSIADVLSGAATWAAGNCDGFMLARWLGAGVVDHVIGDPPYDEQTHAGMRTMKDRGEATSIDFAALPPADTFIPGLVTVAKRWTILFCSMLHYGDIRAAAGGPRDAGGGWVRTGFWHRTNSAPQITGDRPAQPGEGVAILHATGGRMRWNRGGDQAFWEGPIDRDPRRMHPTKKPLWLMEALVRDFTDPGDLVFDPTMGEGTTGEACIRLGRRFIGSEIDPRYYAGAVDRLTRADARPKQVALLGIDPKPREKQIKIEGT